MAEGADSTETDRREGRGRLSSIDLLPEEADAAVAWANEQLRERSLPQTLIFMGFNDRLVEAGVTPISKSSFSRYAVRKAIQFRKHDEARRMSAELVAQLGEGGADEVTVMVAELIKVAMFERLEGGSLDSKALMELARGLSSVVSAQKASAEYRRKLRDDTLKKVDAAIDKSNSVGGADASAVLKRIREDIYGIFEKGAK